MTQASQKSVLIAAWEPARSSALELSRTERHLLRELSIGQRMADVARALGLAPREAAARVRAIYRKMQWALRAGDLTLS